MISQVDILEDLKDSSDEYQYVVLGTYSFDPDFFEWKILPIFRSKDAETILVLSDKNEYQDRFLDMSLAGQEYYIDYCYASQIFHPKFILLIWPDGIKLILGSANLTKQAWFESGEIIGSLTYYFSEHKPQNEKILSDFRDFLSKILEKNYIKSQKHRSKLLEILEKIPMNSTDEKFNVKLIHNMERTILHQVMEMINEPIKSIGIIAPFFNVDGSVFDFFDKAGCKNFQVFIQPTKVRGFPKQKIIQMISNGSTITVNQITFKENEDRFIHAKIMIIKTPTKAFCLYGSANPTFSGMLATPENGNLELCILVYGPEPNYYDNLIENDSLVINPVSLEQIQETTQEPPGKIEPEIINISDAYLEEKKLILEIDQPSEFTDIVLAHFNEEFLDIPFQTQEKRFAINLNDEQFDFCSRPTYVQILFQKNDQQIKSNKRWVSTQTLELTPRKMDIEKIQKTGGRFGLISFLNKLERFADDPQWFYYFLQRIRFENLNTLEPIRRKLVQRKLETEDEKEYEKPPEINLVSNFRAKFEKRNKEIKESLQQMNEFNQEEFKNQFNQFLTWSKIIIWFTLQEGKFIDNLRFIRSNIEEFLVLYHKIKQNKDAVSYLYKINFWQHLLLLSFLMFLFQRKEGFLEKNLGVVRVFKETTTMLISEFENKITFTKEDFNPIIKEYAEFENLEVDLDIMSKFYTEEFAKKIF
jgi:hypothetical protein